MCDKLKKLDFFFSQNVHLTIDKNVYFKTATGAIATIFLITGVLSYATAGIISLKNMDITSLSKEKRYLAPNSNQGFNPGELGFEMAFGLANTEVDHRFVHWQVNYMRWGNSGK
jgi:hypothetical protein